MIKRVFICSCGAEEVEVDPGNGCYGWGQFMGIVDDTTKEADPLLCPMCKQACVNGLNTYRASIKRGQNVD